MSATHHNWNSYLTEHAGEGALLLKKAFDENKEPCPEYDFQASVAGETVDFCFTGKHMAIIVEDEAHDHSDGYYRNLDVMERVKKEGYNLMTYPLHEVKRSAPAIAARLIYLMNQFP